MVRNHEDGYTYLNLHFFFIYPETKFFWVKLIVQGIPDGKGWGIVGILKKII